MLSSFELGFFKRTCGAKLRRSQSEVSRLRSELDLGQKRWAGMRRQIAAYRTLLVRVRKRLGPAKFHMGAYLVIYSALKNKYEGLAAENNECHRFRKSTARINEGESKGRYSKGLLTLLFPPIICGCAMKQIEAIFTPSSNDPPSKKALYETLLRKARNNIAHILRQTGRVHGGYDRVLTRFGNHQSIDCDAT